MKILVVDNNPAVLRIITAFLDELGHDIRTAHDGLSALHLLDEFTPEVVITDLVMPNIGGEKLCRIIRDLPRLNDCFIIILSAIAAEENTADCGADACIAKGKASDVKKHLKALLTQVGRHKSDKLYEVDLTLGLDQVHEREVTRELLNSRNYYAKIVEHLSEGVFGLSRDGLVIYANQSASRLSGLAEEKLLGRDFVALFAENDRVAVRRGLQKISRATNPQPQQIDNDPPLNLNGFFVTLKCLPMEVEGQRAVVVMMEDQSALVLNRLFPRS